MTIAPPHCSCDGPLADLGLGGPCAVHGSKHTKRELEWAQQARDTFRAERDRYREAIEIALPALEGYLQGESGLPFDDPYRATRTAAEALRAASRKGRNDA